MPGDTEEPLMTYNRKTSNLKYGISIQEKYIWYTSLQHSIQCGGKMDLEPDSIVVI